MNHVKHVIQNPHGHRRDDYGAYIPICAYGEHPGLPIDQEVCLMRKCRHFRKVYMKDSTIINLPSDNDHPKCRGLDFQI